MLDHLRFTLLPALAVLSFAPVAQAHHGLDFMLMQDSSIPAPGHFSVFDNSNWSREVSANAYATEPGLYMGITPSLGLGVLSHFADEGDGWAYSATTPYVVVNLLPSDIKSVRIALWAGYEFADSDSETSTTSVSRSRTSRSNQRSSAKASGSSLTTSSGTASSSTSSASLGKRQSKPSSKPTGTTKTSRHGGTGGGSGPDAPATGHNHPTAAAPPPPPPKKDDNDAAKSVPQPIVPLLPADTGHQHRGIHRHGESGLHTRLVVDVTLSEHDRLVANLINFTPEKGRGAWGYGIGWRHTFHHDFAMSLEAVDDFEAQLEHQLMVAAHVSPTHWLTLRLGVGMGLTPATPDLTLQTGIVMRF